MPVFSSLPNGPVTNGIVSTAASTSEEPVSDQNGLNNRLQANPSADSQDQVQSQSMAESNAVPCSSSTETTASTREEIPCEEKNEKEQPQEESTSSDAAEPDSTLLHGEDFEEGAERGAEHGAESNNTGLNLLIH